MVNENTAKVIDKVSHGNTGLANKALQGLMGFLRKQVSEDEYKNLVGQISEQFISSQGEDKRESCEEILKQIAVEPAAPKAEE